VTARREMVLRRWLREQWASLAEGESRIAFPPGEEVWSGLRRCGEYLHVEPGGLRRPFLVHVGRTSMTTRTSRRVR
jgi:hypothetical protein